MNHWTKLPVKQLVVLSLITTLTLISAEAKPSHYKITFGQSLMSFDSSLYLQSEDFSRDDFVDFESNLNFDKKVNLSMLKLESEFMPNHKFSLTFLPISRRAIGGLTKDFSFNQQTYEIGSQIDSQLDVNGFDFEYTYVFYHRGNWSLEALTGLYWVNTKFNLDVSAYIQSDEEKISGKGHYRGTSNTSLPIPLFGLGAEYRLSDRSKLLGSFRYFESSNNGNEGYTTSSLVALEFDLARNWGIGVSYSFFNATFRIEKDLLKDVNSHISSGIQWEYQGTNLYFYANF
ncbi:hypothetical protein [Aliikangiella sp. G2MR2-5]|uniref:hypothetical protein n=1 Tax=Aliikangiella sp. G2MR2-5 TaxID=2788943 RepID=UPI0018AACC65|nr:hypothetical protein [Aliikangiella sp. G2MR2-5]